ncbi:MAG: carbonic anhydrase [Hyphomicrobiaceae bacterium]
MTTFPEQLTDRYRRFKLRHFEPNQDQYQDLAEFGQHPDIMVVSCCDSRVPPETIFSALPGELFVVRNVANLVPPFETTGTFHGVSAALEFAVLNLRVKHVVVLAHSGCGGVKACLQKEAARQTEAQFISNWMTLLDGHRDRIVADNPEADQAAILQELERATVRASLANLRTFPCIKILEPRGRVSLHGAHFDIRTGALEVLDPLTDQFFRL